MLRCSYRKLRGRSWKLTQLWTHAHPCKRLLWDQIWPGQGNETETLGNPVAVFQLHPRFISRQIAEIEL